MKPGRIFAVVGPSGAGKDTLIAGAARLLPSLHVVRRVITRPEEAGGEDFEGSDEAGFARRAAAGEFALVWEAHELRYGIPAADCAKLSEGRDVIFNGSRAALADARALFPGLVVLLVTAPPGLLAERLALRGRETAAGIEGRLSRAAYDLPDWVAPLVIENDGTPAQGIARMRDLLQPVRA